MLDPPVSLLCKLASIAVHADEYLSPHGHTLDADALKTLLADPEVTGWLEQMTAAALAPKKRHD
jgi:vacuolar-type H+-ATPase subunit C/Vma6